MSLKIGISGRPCSASVQAVAASTIRRMSGPTCSRAVRISSSVLLEIVAPVRIGDDLDRLEAELQAAVDVAAHLVRRLAQRIDGAVGEHAVALRLAEQRARPACPRLAADVPERDVDGAHGVDDRRRAGRNSWSSRTCGPTGLDVRRDRRRSRPPSDPWHGCASAALR